MSGAVRDFNTTIERLRGNRGGAVAEFVEDYVLMDRRARRPKTPPSPVSDRSARAFWEGILDDPDDLLVTMAEVSLEDSGLLDEDPSENLWY